jgi:hypothetical protein
MKQLIVLALISIGACALVDTTEDRGAPAVVESAQEITTCDGSPGQWPGCRGNGCAVCAELVGNAPCYFANHPACARNTTCAGQYFTCNNACPQPTAADFNCSGPTTSCGDGVCNGSESCSSCPADCGACHFCGDGVCDGNESCATCQQDCQPCNCGTCNDGSPCCGGPCSDGSFCM